MSCKKEGLLDFKHGCALDAEIPEAATQAGESSEAVGEGGVCDVEQVADLEREHPSLPTGLRRQGHPGVGQELSN